MSAVELVMSLTVPGVIVLMVGVGVFELWRQRRGKRVGTPLTATYVDEFTAMFYGTKRVELESRASMSMMREDDEQGAPPWIQGDLDRGIAILRAEDSGRAAKPE
ncbi:MAG: DUF6191 domain-containing protein [Labedaea sp.]